MFTVKHENLLARRVGLSESLEILQKLHDEASQRQKATTKRPSGFMRGCAAAIETIENLLDELPLTYAEAENVEGLLCGYCDAKPFTSHPVHGGDFCEGSRCPYAYDKYLNTF